ncbi:TetR family transcriptional regulator [Rhodobacter aestuarii]|uniref:Transcriptional regulator, TetR family n=1 Tax=Rhodobacter aestuarii TaxID=453582 RepID=A0A1N7IZ61_9RHOB|nr:TetR/AcrR family transcriptional regulator [Rhodobacter aestuarii]PTV97371.1 TetR family transcriptional regulator [Rhodobacter aestuarii]SIS42261.1 transcriptional regulator, TetR family [Rhodobacter aestuarii]
MTLPQNKKRARSDSEKEARRTAILGATRRKIDSDGFDKVTMNAIAHEAGVSKGTLYLYAQSKEELFLALFVETMEEVVTRIEDTATEDTLAEVLTHAPAEVPLFLALLARLFAVIEPNVSDEALFEEKRRMREMGLRVANVIARLTGAPEEQARGASMVLMLTMQGAAQFDIATQRDPETVPDDLKQAFAVQAFTKSYSVAVRLILWGLTQP